MLDSPNGIILKKTFVDFLVDLKTPKCTFKINWPFGPWVWRYDQDLHWNIFYRFKLCSVGKRVVKFLSIFQKAWNPKTFPSSKYVVLTRPATQIRHIHFIMLKENYPFLVNKKTSLKVRAVDNRHSTPSCLL